MAELQKNIRRVGGQLESHRRPHGERLLLPTEVELCTLLGLSKEEYFEFVDKTSAYNGQRKEGYELIPDIRNEAVTAWAATEAGKVGEGGDWGGTEWRRQGGNQQSRQQPNHPRKQ